MMMPVIARRAARKAYDEELVVRTESASLEALRGELAESRRRTDAIIVAASAFLGGVVWISFGTQPGWAGWLLALGSAIFLAVRLRRPD